MSSTPTATRQPRREGGEGVDRVASDTTVSNFMGVDRVVSNCSWKYVVRRYTWHPEPSYQYNNVVRVDSKGLGSIHDVNRHTWHSEPSCPDSNVKNQIYDQFNSVLSKSSPGLIYEMR